MITRCAVVVAILAVKTCAQALYLSAPEFEVVRLLNEARTDVLSAMRPDSDPNVYDLSRSAPEHAEDMGRTGRTGQFGSDGSNQRIYRHRSWTGSIGENCVGPENVGVRFDDASRRRRARTRTPAEHLKPGIPLVA
jgi:hypothetical protein